MVLFLLSHMSDYCLIFSPPLRLRQDYAEHALSLPHQGGGNDLHLLVFSPKTLDFFGPFGTFVALLHLSFVAGLADS